MTHAYNVPPPRYEHRRDDHHPETVFVNMPQRPETSVRSITVPLILVLFGGVALVSISYAAATQFNGIQYSIARLGDKIDNLTGGLADRITTVEQQAMRRTADRYTMTDHELWCAKTESLNRVMGWRCASTDPVAKKQPTTTDGWTSTTRGNR